jgi:hypothetical protein
MKKLTCLFPVLVGLLACGLIYVSSYDAAALKQEISSRVNAINDSFWPPPCNVCDAMMIGLQAELDAYPNLTPQELAGYAYVECAGMDAYSYPYCIGSLRQGLHSYVRAAFYHLNTTICPLVDCTPFPTPTPAPAPPPGPVGACYLAANTPTIGVYNTLTFEGFGSPWCFDNYTSAQCTAQYGHTWASGVTCATESSSVSTAYCSCDSSAEDCYLATQFSCATGSSYSATVDQVVGSSKPANLFTIGVLGTTYSGTGCTTKATNGADLCCWIASNFGYSGICPTS